MKGLPFSTFPYGWFQLGWSDEFVAGAVVPLDCFGRELVAYRGDSGELHVLDAYCAHMGAHLGYGGKVDGDDVECPFHGWRWSPEGTNVSIPGSERPNRARKLGCWTTAERAGVVLVWYSPLGGPPVDDGPMLVDPAIEYLPIRPEASRAWELAIQPHVVAENSVDSAHFSFVHRAADAPTILSTSADGLYFRVQQEITFGGGKAKTWLTPEGPRRGALDIVLCGLGLAITRFAGGDEAISMVATTPIDETRSMFRMTNWVPRGDHVGDDLPPKAVRRIDEQFKQAKRDHVIWEHMTYVEHPPLTRDEARPYKEFKAWARHLYHAEAVT